MTQKPDKWIVSKRRYVANLGLKGAALSLSVGLLVLSLVCVPLVIILLWVVTSLFRTDAQIAVVGFFILAFLAWGVVYIYRIGKRELKEASQRKVGIPLTRANTGSLPAPASLVRASQKPPQAQEGMLLRAATQSEQTPIEELVRPAGSQEQP